MTHTRTVLTVVLTGSLLVGLSACGGAAKSKGSGGTDGKTELTYALWDKAQQGAYTACIAAFQKENPKISVKIDQTGWDEYWTSLSTKMAAGKAPDVFTNHVARYPQLQSGRQLLELDQAVTEHRVDLEKFRPGLAEMWIRDGKRYGIPKDFDTIGLFVNTELLNGTGTTLEQAGQLTWNPTDGGTFETFIAALSVDSAGRRGTDPGFDASSVKTYGLYAYDPADGYGQTWWANFALSNGWSYADTHPFPRSLNYGDPKLAQTFAWFQRMVKKGYIPSPDKVGKLGRSALLDGGTVAMVADGSWGMGTYAAGKTDVTVLPLPIGPVGRRTVLNGLADSVSAGTKYPQEAVKLVAFLGSKACQDIVADAGVVLPAVTSSAGKAVETMTTKFAHRKGLDPKVFLDAAEDRKNTAPYPIVDRGIDINKLGGDVADRIMTGRGEPDQELEAVNARINALIT
ncbi:carbohydrate ABC transporter substrate-binding protein, CUT1 family [Austwickia chelonae]|uniref:Putative ABC transporter substrate-binding protein n=1 Tax=Austwickia chelonae NBRC 105200 TaxID=1184607 RepID=K6VU49_9MICO|nr:sugar ABC transporter substrate-binding protein [Austwickia chelonae]GAB78870.1 putative ABC transporter substrate-binding protein [Austwickia chelonae NBRC 105200]SEV85632.1 carbohydrate ABC transporter substrate-binding protein, CUT1 family [Austwickia chelonae]